MATHTTATTTKPSHPHLNQSSSVSVSVGMSNECGSDGDGRDRTNLLIGYFDGVDGLLGLASKDNTIKSLKQVIENMKISHHAEMTALKAKSKEQLQKMQAKAEGLERNVQAKEAVIRDMTRYCQEREHIYSRLYHDHDRLLKYYRGLGMPGR